MGRDYIRVASIMSLNVLTRTDHHHSRECTARADSRGCQIWYPEEGSSKVPELGFASLGLQVSVPAGIETSVSYADIKHSFPNIKVRLLLRANFGILSVVTSFLGFATLWRLLA